jgi:type II secretory pathway component GspD/PulD (secretin)
MFKRYLFYILIIGFIFFKTEIGLSLEKQDSEYNDLLISINVKDAEIADVLKMIAEQSGLNIIAGKNVKGNVSITFMEIPVFDALESILEVNNYTYLLEDNVVKIYTHQDKMLLDESKELKVAIFNLENIKVSDIEPILMNLKSQRGKIQANARLNQIVVYDLPRKIMNMQEVIKSMDSKKLIKKHYDLNYADASQVKERIRETFPEGVANIYVDERTHSLVVEAAAMFIKEIDGFILKWDKPSKQVQIEAKIMQVTLDKNIQLGINWEYLSEDGSKKPKSYDVSSNLSLDLSQGGSFRIGSLSSDDYQATLQALEATTNSNLLSAPKITVLDGEEANILLGSTEPYLVTYIDNETKIITEDTKFMDVGIQLTVKPRITQEGYVTLDIEPEVSSARRVPDVSNALAVDTSRAKTVMTVKDGRTVVLGGLIKDEKVDTIKKVPLLGDIPLLGFFFRSKDKSDAKTELIIFITPHIIKEDFNKN